jgi:hypothetical protein
MIIDPQLHILHMEYDEWIRCDLRGFYNHDIPFDFPVVVVNFQLPFLNIEFWQSSLGEEIIQNGKFRW